MSLSLGLWLAACQSTPTTTATKLMPLQGKWEGEGAGGKCSIHITGNSLYYRAGTNWWKTTFTLPEGTEPQQLHATIRQSSPPTNGIGTVVFAIFKIEDGTSCLAEDDGSDKPPKPLPMPPAATPSRRFNFKEIRSRHRRLKD